jgi:hypothetical protein
MKNQIIVRLTFATSLDTSPPSDIGLHRRGLRNLAIILDKVGDRLGADPHSDDPNSIYLFLVSTDQLLFSLARSPELFPSTTIQVFSLASPGDQLIPQDGTTQGLSNYQLQKARLISE